MRRGFHITCRLLNESADDREGILLITEADYGIAFDVRIHFFKNLRITFLCEMHHARLRIIPRRQTVHIGDLHLHRCLRLDFFSLVKQFDVEEARHVHVNIIHC